MSKRSREKGRKAELELAKVLGEALGLDLSRRLQQYQKGGHDLDGWDGVHIECKRYAQASQGDIAAWWKQTLSQCEDGEIPLLAYRADLQAWRFVIRPMDWAHNNIHQPMEVAIEGLVAWVTSGRSVE